MPKRAAIVIGARNSGGIHQRLRHSIACFGLGSTERGNFAQAKKPVASARIPESQKAPARVSDPRTALIAAGTTAIAKLTEMP